MHPAFSQQLVRDHIEDLRDEACRARLAEDGRGRSSARSRLGHMLVALGERLIAASSTRAPVRR